MGTLAATALTLAMIAAFLLGAGGLNLIFRHAERGKGLLMLVAALVLIGNVLIWTL